MTPLNFRFTPPRLWPNVDWSLMAVTILLSMISVVALWGAAADEGGIGPLTGYARRQLQWTIVGIPVMAAAAFFDYRNIRRFVWVLYLIIIVVLLLVLVHGRHIKGATSWFIFSMGSFRLQFQPAEPCKIIVALALAHYLSDRMLVFRKSWHTFIPLIILGIPIFLIMKQPDLGTSVVFLPMAAAMFFVAGLRKRLFILAIIVAVSGAYLAYPHLKPYQKDRIQTFLNPGQDALGKGYNVIQAQTALGSGGFFGKGWGKGTQTNLRFLPEYQTDFVFPTLGEQFGFVGCVTALGLYAFILFRLVYLAMRSKDLFGVLLLSGVAAIYLTHIVLNIGMATGLLPVTGLPLPFLSYGGSFMLTCFLMIGLAVSVGVRREIAPI